jgi:hypothetical protein
MPAVTPLAIERGTTSSAAQAIANHRVPGSSSPSATGFPGASFAASRVRSTRSLCQPTIAWPTRTVAKTRPSSRLGRPARAAAAAIPAAVRNACLGWAARSTSNGPAWRHVRLGRGVAGEGVGPGGGGGAVSVAVLDPGSAGGTASGTRLSGLVAAARAACFLRARLLDNMLEVSTTGAPGGRNAGKSAAPTTRPRFCQAPIAPLTCTNGASGGAWPC